MNIRIPPWHGQYCTLCIYELLLHAQSKVVFSCFTDRRAEPQSQRPELELWSTLNDRRKIQGSNSVTRWKNTSRSYSIVILHRDVLFYAATASQHYITLGEAHMKIERGLFTQRFQPSRMRDTCVMTYYFTVCQSYFYVKKWWPMPTLDLKISIWIV